MNEELRNMLMRLDMGRENDVRAEIADIRDAVRSLWMLTTAQAIVPGVDDNGISRTQAGGITLETTINNANAQEINWWLPLGLSTDDVTAIYCQLIVTIGGKKYLYVGGSFARIGGVTASNIARYNYETRQWEALPWGVSDNGVNGAVRAIAYNSVDGYLYIGGDFLNAGGDATADYAARTAFTADDPIVSWESLTTVGYELNAKVRTIACDSAGETYFGGDFTNAGGDTAADYIAKKQSGGFVNINGAAPSAVYTIDINASDEIFIGGATVDQGFIRKGSGGAWADYNSSSTTYTCYKLAFDPNGLLYAAVGDLLIDNGDGTWRTVDVSAYAVLDVAFDANGYPIVCGSFLDIDGVDAMRAAWFDGATWRPLTNAGGLDGLGGTVYSIIADPDTNTVFAVGDFDTAGTIQCKGIAAFCRPLADALDILAGLPEQYAAYFLTIYAAIGHTHSLANGESVLGSTFSITGTAGTYQDTGLSISLPAAGTYVINTDICFALKGNAGTAWYITAKLYNSTDAADVANSERMVFYSNDAGLPLAQGTIPLSIIVTVAAAKTIKLYAARNGAGTPSWTTSQIPSTSIGRTKMSYHALGT
ncbi:MAG: hypothetical protein HY867_18400 [Chloroflexi bacterium]|nr:hypothetical protein [Chloroflexota bacterium]